MSTTVHRITLASTEHFAGKLPPHWLGYLFAELPVAVCAAVSMNLRNRSTMKGRTPAWLKRAADIRYVNHEGDGDTVLYFEAPSLGEAAEELYRQGELWPTRPDAADTGFDLLGDVLSEVEAGNVDSDRFDPSMLKRLTRFKRALAGPFQEAQIESRRYDVHHPARLSPLVIQAAERLYSETPEPRRVRVVGVLDMLRASNQTLALKMDDGQEIRGTLIEGGIDRLAPLLQSRIIVFGKALFRPSGRLLRVDVDEFRTATDADQFFAKTPKPMGSRRLTPLDHKVNAEALRAAFGQWPGDETDEEIEAALKELS